MRVQTLKGKKLETQGEALHLDPTATSACYNKSNTS